MSTNAPKSLGIQQVAIGGTDKGPYEEAVGGHAGPAADRRSKQAQEQSMRGHLAHAGRGSKVGVDISHCSRSTSKPAGARR